MLLLLPAGVAGQAPPDLGPVPTGMFVDVTEVRYEVVGATAEELRMSMRAAGPRHEGRSFDGYTRWNVRWTYRFEPAVGGCRMTDVRVEYSAEMTLPLWEPPAGASRELVGAWQSYYEALRVHEEGHRNIGAAAAREVLRELRSLRVPNCSSMRAEANALGDRILDRARRNQARYDEETRHGMTQGAVWPPSAAVTWVPERWQRAVPFTRSDRSPATGGA